MSIPADQWPFDGGIPCKIAASLQLTQPHMLRHLPNGAERRTEVENMTPSTKRKCIVVRGGLDHGNVYIKFGEVRGFRESRQATRQSVIQTAARTRGRVRG